MRTLLSLTAVLAAAVLFAIVVSHDPGYVVIGVGHWVVETSAVLAALLLAVLYFALAVVFRLISRVLRFPGRVRLWRARRRHAAAARDFVRGLTALAEGRWQLAEETLTRNVQRSDNPLLHHLAAARAAHRLQAWARRDMHLLHAQQAAPDAVIAVGLQQAELLAAQGELDRARASLVHLRGIAPKHAEVLRQLKGVALKLKDWTLLADLIEDLRRHQVVRPAEIDALEGLAHEALLEKAAADGGVEAMQKAFDALPRGLRHNARVVGAYAREMVRRGEGARAEVAVRAALARDWSEELAALYGDIPTEDPDGQLANGEAWLKDHAKSAVLLLALGKVCARARLWGKARVYLESSIGAAPSAQAYRELGALLEHLGDPDRALEVYRKAVELAVNATERHVLLKDKPEFRNTGRFTATRPPRDPFTSSARRSGGS